MEKLQLGPIHPCLLEEYLEQENGGLGSISCGGQFINRFEDPHCSLPSLEDKMPFLQMLQGFEPYPQLPLSPPLMAADTAATFPFLQEPSFQLLLKLQQEKMNMNFFAAGELESCVTTNNNDMIMELHSPIKSEVTYKDQTQIPTPPLTQTLSPTNQRENQRKKGARSKRMTQLLKSSVVGGAGGGDAAAAVSAAPKERRKRKRAARPSKNKEQVESQRMTHIAVERNRRRQMNEHLNALRSLMPPSYVQRGDQASIIGGAIDFVKELEQLLQSLQAQKRMKQCEDQNGDVSATSTSTSSSSNFFSNMFMASSSSSPSSSLQFRNAHNFHEEGNHHEEICAENRSSLGNIEVVVIQNHVNLKVQCERRPGQLLKAIVALEDLRLSVLHLNITSLHSLVLYSFNLKIEDDCKLGSADEVASAVHQIFSLINIS